MKGLHIIGTGRALPKKCVTNEDMKAYVDTSDEWIRTRTGIGSRYFSEEETNHGLSEEAARKAIARAGISVDQIGVCIVATVTPDYATPSVACLLQRDLGLEEDIPAFDINAACSGFLYGLNIASRFLDEAHPYGLVIGSEQLSRILNMEDRTTCVLFGDGAGAAVVERSDHHVYYSKLGAQGDDESLFCNGLGRKDPYIHMRGQAIFRFAVKAIDQCMRDAFEQTGYTMEDVDYVVCHQANQRIISHVQKKWKADPEKFVMNMECYGNTSAASIPILLDEMFEEGKLTRGKRILCVGFGGGLTWASALLEL